MANYVSTSDLNLYLWTSWEDTLIAVFNWIATSMINNYLGVTDLASATYTNEEYDLYWNNNSFFDRYNFPDNTVPNYIYYLNQINPTSVTHINWVAVWNYKLNWRRLELQYTPTGTETVFNKVKITYIAWFSTIPDDIKAVVYNLVWYLYNSKKSQWINEFTQWQLTVKYWSNWTSRNNWDWDVIINNILAWLNKYRKNNILSN